ncbi:MAG: hypothetical protein JJ979_24505, partial [Roseibium sp.]|nr:hypothetical protein [Roseibium sp.]
PAVDTGIHWPNLVTVCSETGITRERARDLHTRVVNQWSKLKHITQLRNDIVEVLADHGGVMTAAELSEVVLLRRGSSQSSPWREQHARAVTRAAIETELARQQSRVALRRSGRRILIADDREGRGEDLADYGEALGQLADEIAESEPLASPGVAIDRVRAVVAPDSFAGMSSHRLLRLASAASQNAALSSRAEFYPRGMSAERALELGQGALLGSPALSVAEIHARIQGRYPEAQPLPGRPELDQLVKALGLGFTWDPGYEDKAGGKGAYCLPQAGESTWASRVHSTVYETRLEDGDPEATRQVRELTDAVRIALDSGRFLALSVRPSYYKKAREKLLATFDLRPLSFDELLLRHLHAHCERLPNPPRWEVVLNADDKATTTRDWANLQNLVRRVLPEMAAEIEHAEGPVLLAEAGLIARYDLVNTWLSDLREALAGGRMPHALILLIANDVSAPAATIDGITVPTGAGTKEYARIPGVWLRPSAEPSTNAGSQ